MQVRKQQLELDMEQQTGSRQEKVYVKAVYCHPAYLTYMQSTSWIKIAGRNIHNLRYADETTLIRKWRRTKEPLDEREKEESGKVGLKLNIQKTKIMASGPITPWEIDGERVETVTDFIFWAPKSLQMVITAMKLKDAHSLEVKWWLT